MKRTTRVNVPVTVGDRALIVTYRVSVATNHPNGNALAAGGAFNMTWGYVEAVPVRVYAERQFDFIIDPDGEGAPGQ